MDPKGPSRGTDASNAVVPQFAEDRGVAAIGQAGEEEKEKSGKETKCRSVDRDR
jgi:hypothetical protein